MLDHFTLAFNDEFIKVAGRAHSAAMLAAMAAGLYGGHKGYTKGLLGTGLLRKSTAVSKGLGYAVPAYLTVRSAGALAGAARHHAEELTRPRGRDEDY